MDIPLQIKVPALETRQVIDKTVGYITKNGEAFETRLRNSSDAKSKFPFIFSSDEHYDYYQWKLGRYSQTQNGLVVSLDTNHIPEIAVPPLEFLLDLPVVSVRDLAVIKLAALFVAQNGDQYATELHKRQSKGIHKAQFDFMNASHSLHPVYKQFVTQYRKTLEVLDTKVQVPELFVDAYHRAIDTKVHKVKRDTEKRLKQERRMKYASIDWQDFSIVGKLEFDDIDKVTELAVPLNRDDLVYRSLESKTREIELQKAAVEPEKIEAPASEPETNDEAPVPKGMKIRLAGESRLKKKSKDKTIKCPITGKQIPELQFEQHIRILLRDPNYEKERQNYIDKNFKYTSNLTNDEVYENIKRLTRKRQPDKTLEPEAKKIGPSSH